ncbi:type I restriction endonuclease subunit R [Erysipelothrix urinaevulpis]|uniref:type I restriction endonuclease subunit R n=1 Tax=Erysipelothrix urinaevulpis TaxID=2683717 RepID=UPI001356A140|nr:HsdR family type I site-specific deoxyribonuclease [Erysipelothrix urinaevulpis]
MSVGDYNSEAQVEERLIEVLAEGVNQWVYRDDLKSVDDLWGNLRVKITQNNLAELNDVPLSDNEFEKVKVELMSKTVTPFDAARWLKGENGFARINIERDDTCLGRVSLVLYSNHDIAGGISSYEVVNQIATSSDSEASRSRRFDITLLINGLPLIQIELKQIKAKDGFYQAFNQIKKYTEEGTFRNNIFSTLQLFVISNEQNTRYFANSLSKDMDPKNLFTWRTRDNKKVDDIYEFTKQFLSIPRAHEMIADYTILSEDQSHKRLMVLHPYQVHAIERIYESASRHEGGYIWHATGSGKTLTSFVSTKLLAKKPGVDRTIMLVDRKDLDNQTTSEFTKFASEYNTGISSYKGAENALIVGTGSSRELSKVLLSDANSNVVIITTRQKLEAALKYAREQEESNKENRFKKLIGQHIVFIVDECHRAISSEGMASVKSFFPNSTWFGFTGTPIFEVNKKEAKGQLARTTPDQYGKELHTYTIKNALDDKSVLGFQVEHDHTIHDTDIDNVIFDALRAKRVNQNKSDDQLHSIIGSMDGIKRETYIDDKVYEDDMHVESVVKKMLKPDNAYVKFDFENGRPTKSAILTTNSIEMAKKYYKKIQDIKKNSNWIEELYRDSPVQKGRVIDDPDFPRIAITYSIDENSVEAAHKETEMENIIDDYNNYYNTSWNISEINRYNSDINNRLARKKAEFKKFGQQIDLVIVVNRLLTGFDAPQVLTLFVDRNLEYANLIQAFSRTNRTYPGKNKGLIVTYRKPLSMEDNVNKAVELYSHSKEHHALIYPDYEESKKEFKLAFDALSNYSLEVTDENVDIETKIQYVRDFQRLQKAQEALITYDKYNEEYEESEAMRSMVALIKKHEGTYNSIKGSLQHEAEESTENDLTEINFYSEHKASLYNIDSRYIDQLLDAYTPHDTSVRSEIEKALQNMNKADVVKEVYKNILDEIDTGNLAENEDIFSVRRRYFSDAKENIIDKFSKTWFVDRNLLYTSAFQYEIGSKNIPNLPDILKSKDFSKYKENNIEVKPFKYTQDISREWMKVLNENIVLYDNELK